MDSFLCNRLLKISVDKYTPCVYKALLKIYILYIIYKLGGGPTPITPETDQILPVGHGQ